MVNYQEESLSAATHYIGAGMAISGLVCLISHSFEVGSPAYLIGSTIFCIGLIFMYMMSGTYHIIQNEDLKKKFRVLDHIAIYVSISATYTPFILTSLTGRLKWIMFFTQWGFTLLGTIFKIFFTGRFKLLSTLIYLFMGWMIVFIYKDVQLSISASSLRYLIAGGVAYSVGAVVYMLKNIRFTHPLWHLFVIGGSIYHYLAVYCLY